MGSGDGLGGCSSATSFASDSVGNLFTTISIPVVAALLLAVELVLPKPIYERVVVGMVLQIARWYTR